MKILFERKKERKKENLVGDSGRVKVRKKKKTKTKTKTKKQNKTKLEFCGSRLTRSLYSQNKQRWLPSVGVSWK